MRVTIVGGCGFIGSHLVDRLCDDGHRVHVVDNRAYGIKYDVRRRGATLFEKGTRKWIREPRGEYCFDLLGQGSADDFNRDPRGCATFNVGSVGLVTKFAKENRGGFLLVSDVARCGQDFRPYGYYIRSKRLGEECAKHSIKMMGVRGHILRLYPVFGPRMSTGRLVGDMILSATMGKDILVYGDGSEMVAPVHVLDVVDAMVACMSLKEPIAEPLVIGGDKLLSVSDLAKLVKKLANSRSKIVFVEREADKPVEPPDFTIAERVLGWKPRITLEDGLIELCAVSV